MNFTYSGKTTADSHFVRRGDYRLIIRDSEPKESALFCIITCVFILKRFNLQVFFFFLLINLKGTSFSQFRKVFLLGRSLASSSLYRGNLVSLL